MNFIETLIESIQTGLKQVNGEYPNEIRSYCIGSGSNFIIHRNISIIMANNLYENYKKNMPLGKIVSTKENGDYKIESFHTLESQTGITYCFMFPINEVIEHDPNEIILEWMQTDKEHKGFMQDLLNEFEKQYDTKSKQNQ